MIFYGVIMAAKVRKVLVSSLYDKVGSLSIKAVTSTNSGKLVTLVSADIFMMERALKRTAISLIGAHSLLKDGGKQAAIQEGYEHIFHAMLARIERDIAHARAVLNVNEVKL